MKHSTIVATCERLGLKVSRVPADGRHSYTATLPGIHVYWSTSTLGGMLGLPRIMANGRDTHCRNEKEIEYLIKDALSAH